MHPSLRKCVEAIRRINKFRNREGRGQANFVRSILDTYGGDDGERLPLGTVLTCARPGKPVACAWTPEVSTDMLCCV